MVEEADEGAERSDAGILKSPSSGYIVGEVRVFVR
jgi:hypothetical protein